MTDDDVVILDGLGALEAPILDTEADLRRVHRRGRHRTLLARGAPVAALVLVAVGVLTVANRPTAFEQAGVNVLRGNVAQAAEPPSAARDAAAGLTEFSLDLFKKVAAESPDQNTVLSPASVYFSLAMVLLGARGQTRTQLERLLHTDTSESALASLNALATELAAPRASDPAGSDPNHPDKTLPPRPGAEIRLANSVWVSHGMPVEQPFLDELSRTFGADAYAADFARHTESSRKAINDWVSKRTDGKITDLLGKSQLDRASRLVLANAVAFSGVWELPFGDPTPGSFTTAVGGHVTAQMLSKGGGSEPSGNAGDGWKSARVQMVGGTHLLVIAPHDPNGWDGFVGSLSAATLTEADKPELGTTLEMPVFSSTTERDLSSALQTLGATDAFDPADANFAGISRAERLYLKTVQHQARVSVDKHGIEAAAATASVFEAVSAIGVVQHVILDHPFVYAIMDDATGAPLFIGQVTDPSRAS